MATRQVNRPATAGAARREDEAHGGAPDRNTAERSSNKTLARPRALCQHVGMPGEDDVIVRGSGLQMDGDAAAFAADPDTTKGCVLAHAWDARQDDLALWST